MTIMTMKSSSILFAALAAASASTPSMVMAQQSDKFVDPALTDQRMIVGGEQSEIGDYPYFVEMGGGCGGALIAPDIVLFAAQCGNWSDKQLIIGAYKKESLKKGAQERWCEEWIAHPNYDEGTLNNDFALCKLNEPVFIDESKVRLVINEDSSVPAVASDLVVMGLGALTEGGQGPKFLHNVTVPVVSNANCNKNNAYGGEVTDQMLCAGFLDTGGKDTCNGDSGGPIVQRTYQGDGTFVDNHVGVVSWGYGCAKPNKPGVYARTSSGSSWIKTTMCNNFNSIASFCNHSPTASPPTPTPCDQNLKIEVTTNNCAFDNIWMLDDTNPPWNKVQYKSYLINNYENKHTLCLESNKCYDWEITDNRWYSTNCKSKVDASYTVSLNGEEKASGYVVGASVGTLICTGAGGPMTSCVDDPDFKFQNKKRKTCLKWVAEGSANKVLKKCKKSWNEKKVYEWCPETCGKKAGIGSCDFLKQ